MAISTYANLKTALETWLARSGDVDVVANAADCIAMGESRLNRLLDLRMFRADATLTGTVSSRSLTLPTDFVEPIALFVTISGSRVALSPKIAGTFVYRTTTGVPVAWCINGSNIDLDCLLDSAYSFSFRYRQSFALSDTAPTNWLLTNHPDCYLSAAMVHAAILVGDSNDIQIWQSALNQHIEEINEKENRNRSIATLIVDPALTTNLSSPGHFDFTSGT
jgi:hypothetical protein